MRHADFHYIAAPRIPFALALLCSALLSVAGCAGNAKNGGATASSSDFPRAGDLEAGEQACSRDIECALADDCCGCARGGVRVGVRSDKLDALSARSESVCAERTCAEQPSQHKSCQASAARCLGGTCVPAL